MYFSENTPGTFCSDKQLHLKSHFVANDSDNEIDTHLHFLEWLCLGIHTFCQLQIFPFSSKSELFFFKCILVLLYDEINLNVSLKRRAKLFLKSLNLNLVLKYYFSFFPQQLLFECPPKTVSFKYVFSFLTTSCCGLGCTKTAYFDINQEFLALRIPFPDFDNYKSHTSLNKTYQCALFEIFLSISGVDSAERCLRNWTYNNFKTNVTS